MKLSILIPIIERHKEFANKLIDSIEQQSQFYGDIEIATCENETDNIGAKRNKLLAASSGQYVAFIDADDRISNDYINRLMWGIKLGVDCCSLKGSYSVDGVFNGVFEHSSKYKEWKTTTNEIKYERYPNHLNCIKADIAKQFKFPEINHGEDHKWAEQIHKSGLLKTEHYIDSIIYYYDKRTIQPKG